MTFHPSVTDANRVDSAHQHAAVEHGTPVEELSNNNFESIEQQVQSAPAHLESSRVNRSPSGHENTAEYAGEHLCLKHPTDSTDKIRADELVAACRHGELATAERLFAAGIKLQPQRSKVIEGSPWLEQDDLGEYLQRWHSSAHLTVLDYAASNGHDDIVSLILTNHKCSAEVRANAAIEAIARGQQHILPKLIVSNDKPEDWQPVLGVAMNRGNTQAIALTMRALQFGTALKRFGCTEAVLAGDLAALKQVLEMANDKEERKSMLTIALINTFVMQNNCTLFNKALSRSSSREALYWVLEQGASLTENAHEEPEFSEGVFSSACALSNLYHAFKPSVFTTNRFGITTPSGIKNIHNYIGEILSRAHIRANEKIYPPACMQRASEESAVESAALHCKDLLSSVGQAVLRTEIECAIGTRPGEVKVSAALLGEKRVDCVFTDEEPAQRLAEKAGASVTHGRRSWKVRLTEEHCRTLIKDDKLGTEVFNACHNIFVVHAR
jgi:hypothetical protein